MEKKTKVVVVGGTGYLGQHLLQALAGDRYDVAFTHHSCPLPRLLLEAFPHFPSFHVDLKTGLGFHSISHHFGQVRRINYPFFRRISTQIQRINVCVLETLWSEIDNLFPARRGRELCSSLCSSSLWARSRFSSLHQRPFIPC